MNPASSVKLVWLEPCHFHEPTSRAEVVVNAYNVCGSGIHARSNNQQRTIIK